MLGAGSDNPRPTRRVLVVVFTMCFCKDPPTSSSQWAALILGKSDLCAHHGQRQAAHLLRQRAGFGMVHITDAQLALGTCTNPDRLFHFCLGMPDDCVLYAHRCAWLAAHLFGDRIIQICITLEKRRHRVPWGPAPSQNNGTHSA